jgi:hypothetical protein
VGYEGHASDDVVTVTVACPVDFGADVRSVALTVTVAEDVGPVPNVCDGKAIVVSTSVGAAVGDAARLGLQYSS